MNRRCIMNFLELRLKEEYRSFSDNIVLDFYIPVMKRAVKYKRAVGFFSSSALIELSRGIAGLVQNGGDIKLIASPKLQEDDILAMKKGYEDRIKVVERVLLSSWYEPKIYFEEQRLNLLANLIAEGRLDIKIAFTTSSSHDIGMYHEKMGLLYDINGNVIAFSGSMNESSTAFSHNYEAIDVFCSWKDEKSRIETKENAFNSIWNDTEPHMQVLDFPKIAQDKLLSYRKKQDLEKVLYEVDTIDKNSIVCDPTSTLILGPLMPANIKLHDYQLEAINSWAKKDFRGIFDMATGTGKTYTGLGALTKLYDTAVKKLAVFIVCPFQHLVEQWVEDVRNFNMDPIIGYSSSSQKDWQKRLKDAIRDQKLNVRNKEFFCFICTNATFSSKFVQEHIQKIRTDTFLLVDEAHNFGSDNLSKLLINKFNYRLALSATIVRHNDDEGTAKLFEYFGETCIEYSLDRAIAEKKLTKYKYYPIIVTLNDYELKKYEELTYELGKCVIKGKDNKIKLSARGKYIALERARLIAGAKNKIKKLKECIYPYINDKHILVYCGATKVLNADQDYTSVDDEDLRQIDVVTDLLGNTLKMNISQFTSREDIAERVTLKKEFAEGENLQALIAIKCLDEGVNIPNIKVAFILASTTNPKEYIQRRGRVLRLAPGKDFAEIYDFITLPRQLNEVPSLTKIKLKNEITLVKNELSRGKEFARIAMNMVEAEKVLDNIKDVYNIKDHLITFKEDYGYE